jgi:hypothetical protein
MGEQVDFCRVTREMFEDAGRKCPQICEVFLSQCKFAVGRSGDAEGEGGMSTIISVICFF